MRTVCTLRKAFAGALLSGGVALAGWGLATGTASAQPEFVPPFHGPFADGGPYTWCPGESLSEGITRPGGRGAPGPINWDMGRCHTWYYVNWGYGNVSPGIFDGDNPPPEALTPRTCPPIAFMCP